MPSATPAIPSAAPTPAAAWPTPQDRPEADIVVYDGNCNFCKSQVKKLLAWDPRGSLAYLSLHDPVVGQRWPDLEHERLMQEMVVIDREGRRHWGPEAIRHLTHRLPRLWWAAWVFHMPGVMFIWRRIYRWVARNRYRLSAKLGHDKCDTGACQLHYD